MKLSACISSIYVSRLLYSHTPATLGTNAIYISLSVLQSESGIWLQTNCSDQVFFRTVCSPVHKNPIT